MGVSSLRLELGNPSVPKVVPESGLLRRIR